VATPRNGLVAVPIGGGPERPLVAARAGERVGGLAWSPDGTRVAFVRQTESGSATLETVVVARPAATAVLARMPLAEPVGPVTAWPAADRVVYIANEPDGAALLAVPAAATSAAPVALVRWREEYVAQLAWGLGRMVVLRGPAERTIKAAAVDRRGYFLNLLRSVPEHILADQLAGWTTDGRLVHATDGNVVASVPFGASTVLTAGSPDAVAGDAVVYHRGTAIRSVAVAGGGDRALAELAAAGAGDVVRCAGDRAPPCVIAEVDHTGVRYVRFDPATGARGGELHRVPQGQRLTRSMAVSPDGATLAVVDGSPAVTLIALDGGRAEREQLAPSTEAVEVSWSHDGASLLVSVLGGGDARASVIRLWRSGRRQLLLHSDQIWYDRVREAPGGSYVAIQTRELTLDAWLIEGL
jgi:hypothetical protein